MSSKGKPWSEKVQEQTNALLRFWRRSLSTQRFAPSPLTNAQKRLAPSSGPDNIPHATDALNTQPDVSTDD